MSRREQAIKLTQHELAAAFDVARSTVQQWQSEGLPYTEDGVRNTYRLGVAGYWVAGRNYLKARKQPIRSPAMTVMIGRVLTSFRHATPEPLAEFLKGSRAFMREHFGTAAEIHDRMAGQALKLVMD